MSTQTDKLGLIIPDGQEYADVDDFNSNFVKLDKDAGVKRSAEPGYVGEISFTESDPVSHAKTLYQWSGTGLAPVYEDTTGDLFSGGEYLDEPVNTTLIQAESGWDIYYYYIRMMENNIVAITVSCKATTSYNVGPSGNIANYPMVRINNTRFHPVSGNNSLATVGGGPKATGNIQTYQSIPARIMLAAVWPGAQINKGDEYALGGVYYAKKG